LIGTPLSFASQRKSIKYIFSLVAVDRAIYSTSVEDKAISVCNLDDQISGHPANMIK
jgi:hypothetical protein